MKTMLDVYADLVVALAHRLTDLGHADAVEAEMIAVIDPHYETLRDKDPMMDLLDLCERVRAVTGLPVLPKGPELEGPGQV